MLKRTWKLIIDRLRLVFLCRAPARLRCPLLCTLRCFFLVAASSWLHFPCPCIFDFFVTAQHKDPRTYQEVPGTHFGKLAKPSFPFNCFAWGQISLKMLKVASSNLIIRNGILRFNGAWMQKKKKKVWESLDKISRIRFFAPQCTSFRLRSVLFYHFTFRGPHIFTIPTPQQPACVITQAILT